MTELKQSLIEILNNHRGRHRAITGKSLALSLGFKDDRLIRITIRDLIAEGYPIASVTESPGGYFICETYQEAQDYMRNLRDRLIEDARRRRDFRLSAFRSFEKVTQGRLV